MGSEMMLALLGPIEAPGDVDWSNWDDVLQDFLRRETGCVVSRKRRLGKNMVTVAGPSGGLQYALRRAIQVLGGQPPPVVGPLAPPPTPPPQPLYG